MVRFYAAGIYGSYWSSTVNDRETRYLALGRSSAYIDIADRAFGISVRCIKD